MPFYCYLEILAIILSLYYGYKLLKSFGDSSRCIIFFLFFSFYVLPLILDYLFGLPSYETQDRYYGFAISYRDNNTRTIYSLFVILCLFVIYHSKKKELKNHLVKSESKVWKPFLRLLFFLGMIAPVLLTIVLPVNKLTCVVFQWREFGVFEYNSNSHTIEDFSYIGVCCSILLFFDTKKKNLVFKSVCLLFLYFDICTQGKRSILFFAIFTIVLILFLKLLRRKRKDSVIKTKLLLLFVLMGVSAIVMIGSSIIVKITTRGYNSSDIETLYLSTRIDFFKDDRVRMAIYSMLYPEKMQILPSTGKTIFCIPLWFWPISHFVGLSNQDFPSYQDYFSTALQNSTQLGEYAPFMTTCFPAELISNFGVFGIFVFAVLLFITIRTVDSTDYPANALIIILFLIIQMYTIKYLNMLILFILVSGIIYKFNSKKVTRYQWKTSN